MQGTTFEVYGGKSLQGSIRPQGAKNEALEVLCAVLLTEEKVTISNIPDILDVNRLIEILKSFGVKVERINADTYTFQSDEVNTAYFETEEFRTKTGKLRGSVMTLGPLLARYKKAYLPQPGGDKIGRRRLDAHFLGLEALGASFHYNTQESTYHITTEGGLKGNYILMEEPSVTGTANIIMAAVLAKGMTTIYHAACEPYTQQLCKMLNRMGADIRGIGSNLLRIKGVDKLYGCEHRVLPDMLEVGSFLGMAAITKSEIRIQDAAPAELGMLPRAFRKIGIRFDIEGEDILVPAQDSYEIQTFIDGSILTIYDHPWPGVSPDLLSILLVVATQARGSILIHQKMFESRLFFVDRLIEMGAQIILCDPHRAVVIGIDRRYPLRGIKMSSPDIRAGIALLIAALSAEGKSTINNISQIDRGYQNIDTRLIALGAEIKRV